MGILQWSRTFGGSGDEDGWLLDIANDGGYLTGGSTRVLATLPNISISLKPMQMAIQLAMKMILRG